MQSIYIRTVSCYNQQRRIVEWTKAPLTQQNCCFTGHGKWLEPMHCQNLLSNIIQRISTPILTNYCTYHLIEVRQNMHQYIEMDVSCTLDFSPDQLEWNQILQR